jgi:CRP-like cAMP-binding protein
MNTPPLVTKRVNSFFAKYPLKKYDSGEIMLLAGEDPKCIFYLVNGNVREYDISYKGEEVVVNVFKNPSFFPMSWLLNKTPNCYFYQALGQVSVRQADSDEVLAFVTENSDVMLDLLKRLYIGTDGMKRRMAHLMGGNAKSRLLFELIVEGQRFGIKSDAGILVTLSESEIGSRAGLSRETVSREIKLLKNQGLISVSRRGILLDDIDVLEKRLGPDL